MRKSLRLLSIIPILAPIFRVQVQAFRTIPTIAYPICRRNFTCSPPLQQDFQTIMSDLSKEESASIKKMAEPTEKEAEILKKPENCNEEATSSTATPAKGEAEEKTEPPLPKLSAADFRVYNSMAEHMEYFHNHFRQTWTLLHTACLTNTRPSSMSLKSFLQTGLQFISHLEAHHSIEEAHIFPVLARKMPEFKNGKQKAELLRQHQAIHVGMEGFGGYLEECRRGERELVLRELKEKMDCWGEVLWKHLDQEVKTLGAENMRRYWTLEEMKRMPM